MEEERFQQTLLMKQILEEIAFLKSKMPNGELLAMQNNIEILKNNQSSMKDDLSDLKKKLLDPEMWNYRIQIMNLSPVELARKQILLNN